MASIDLSLLFVPLIGAATWVLSQRKTAKGRKYVCHEDGSTDCPCYTSEKRAPLNPKSLGPSKATLEPGKALWMCTCGQSKNYPYCDGSHRAYNAANGTSFVPQKIEAKGDAAEDVWVCNCGHSKNKPFCDGSHRKVKLSSA